MAPEIQLAKPYSGPGVDLFASAIILFIMISQRPPFASPHPEDPHYRLLAAKRADLFWKAHDAALPAPSIYSDSFKDLFERMTALNPSHRMTMEEVLNHPWLQGETSSKADINSEFESRQQVVNDAASADRDSKRAERAEKHAERKVRRGDPELADKIEQEDEEMRIWVENLEMEDFDPCF